MAILKLWEALAAGEEQIPFGRLALELAGRGEVDGRRDAKRDGSSVHIAVDTPLWLFQASAMPAQQQTGSDSLGMTPALRTIFFRMCRLLALGFARVTFVFDGEQRPAVKRGRARSVIGTGNGADSYTGNGTGTDSYTGNGAATANSQWTPYTQLERQVQSMARLFGFHVQRARGEAEAECARLWREGVVDAVLSDDNDCFVFGAGVVVRNWKAQGAAVVERRREAKRQVTSLDDDNELGAVEAQPLTRLRPSQAARQHPYHRASVYWCTSNSKWTSELEKGAPSKGATGALGTSEQTNNFPSRDQLLLIALLAPTDYADGVRNIGTLTALELARCADYASRFAAIVHASEQDVRAATSQLPAHVHAALLPVIREMNATLHRRKAHAHLGPCLSRARGNASIPEDGSWPPLSVLQAYWFPVEGCVDASDVASVSSSVRWPLPCLPELRDFCRIHLGWGASKWQTRFEGQVLPSLRRRYMYEQLDFKKTEGPADVGMDVISSVLKRRNLYGYDEVLVEWNDEAQDFQRFLDRVGAVHVAIPPRSSDPLADFENLDNDDDDDGSSGSDSGGILASVERHRARGRMQGRSIVIDLSADAHYTGADSDATIDLTGAATPVHMLSRAILPLPPSAITDRMLAVTPPPPSGPALCPGAPMRKSRAKPSSNAGRSEKIDPPLVTFRDRLEQALGMPADDADPELVAGLHGSSVSAEATSSQVTAAQVTKTQSLTQEWLDVELVAALCPSALQRFDAEVAARKVATKKRQPRVAKRPTDDPRQPTLDMFWGKRARSTASVAVISSSTEIGAAKK